MMTFKDWWEELPHWLKGGIIGMIIFIPLFIGLIYINEFIIKMP